ncbi:MAG: coproporphyrinogen III oxidase [Proteobacteria bacterium]|nr:coproporphyrinogen III oxidase [Pseudomonadota bacterium]MBI3498739.1 coproporphyrinogen III oxidase [Pseudomonadota bacterium]
MTALKDALAVYIHWPFCRSKCPYCDFNSHVAEAIDQARWREALAREIDWYAAKSPGRTVTSIFFGGGTPSLMPPETAQHLIRQVGLRWDVASDVEITLEANPTSVEAGRFEGFRAAGVNRVSLGVQALNDRDLAFLGRGHSASEALAAVAVAQRLFQRSSFDLIYGRPHQSVAAWRAELEAALARAGSHLSLYQLTIEEGTQFHTRYQRGDFELPDDELAGALYEETQRVLERAGLPAYEISNHARPGEESRHNLTYWRYGDYVGIGPGAHGRLRLADGKYALNQIRAPDSWLTAVEAAGHGTKGSTVIQPAERLQELLMMGLRLVEGVSRERFRGETGFEPEAALSQASIAALVEGGFLVLDRSGLRATAAGRQRLNAVLARLLA